MARVLFDPHFAQARQHRYDLGRDVAPYPWAGPSGGWAVIRKLAYSLGRLGLTRNSEPRLRSVCDLLIALGLEPTFPENELPSPSGMDEVEIIVTGSRLKAFTDDEIASLVRFAEERGGLLIMSNHGAAQGAPNDFTRYDRPLVDRFGIELECTGFSGLKRSRAVPVSGAHPTTKGVRELSINNCSSLRCARAPSVVDIPSNWHDRLAGIQARGRAAAVAIDEGIDGRVFVLSDSGFMGNEGTRSPGPGLIDQADNRKFLTNVFSWLAKIDTRAPIPSNA